MVPRRTGGEIIADFGKSAILYACDLNIFGTRKRKLERRLRFANCGVFVVTGSDVVSWSCIVEGNGVGWPRADSIALLRQGADPSPMLRAVLLDRDGVVNRDPGTGAWVCAWEEFEFLPGAVAALRRLTEHGLKLAVITNQSCVGRGRVALQVIDDICTRMQDSLADQGVVLAGVFVCPHCPDDGCDCRKPRPGNLLRAAQACGARPQECCFIGDQLTDLQAARNAGMVGHLVRSGRQVDDERVAEMLTARGRIFADLSAAADYLVQPLT